MRHGILVTQIESTDFESSSPKRLRHVIVRVVIFSAAFQYLRSLNGYDHPVKATCALVDTRFSISIFHKFGYIEGEGHLIQIAALTSRYISLMFEVAPP